MDSVAPVWVNRVGFIIVPGLGSTKMTTQQADKMWEEAKKFADRHKDNYPSEEGWTVEKILASAFAYGFQDGICEGRRFQTELGSSLN